MSDSGSSTPLTDVGSPGEPGRNLPVQCLDAFCPRRFETHEAMIYHCVVQHGEGRIECPNKHCFYRTEDVNK